MKAAFDIFENLPDGHPMWVEAVGTLDQARQKVRELTARTNTYISSTASTME